jgi:DNA-binding transcriptional regulator YiaG
MSPNASLARRIREVRTDLYGEFGIESFARALNLPVESWRNFEQGVTMPAEIMLKFLDITDTDPHWMLSGERAVARGV